MEKYNGWTNYETWKVALWVNNRYELDEVKEVIDNNSAWEIVKESLLSESFYNDIYGSCNINVIDWEELENHFESDEEEKEDDE